MKPGGAGSVLPSSMMMTSTREVTPARAESNSRRSIVTESQSLNMGVRIRVRCSGKRNQRSREWLAGSNAPMALPAPSHCNAVRRRGKRANLATPERRCHSLHAGQICPSTASRLFRSVSSRFASAEDHSVLCPIVRRPDVPARNEGGSFGFFCVFDYDELRVSTS